jgi:hypothetical protein
VGEKNKGNYKKSEKCAIINVYWPKKNTNINVYINLLYNGNFELSNKDLVVQENFKID